MKRIYDSSWNDSCYETTRNWNKQKKHNWYLHKHFDPFWPVKLYSIVLIFAYLLWKCVILCEANRPIFRAKANILGCQVSICKIINFSFKSIRRWRTNKFRQYSLSSFEKQIVKRYDEWLNLNMYWERVENLQVNVIAFYIVTPRCCKSTAILFELKWNFFKGLFGKEKFSAIRKCEKIGSSKSFWLIYEYVFNIN